VGFFFFTFSNLSAKGELAIAFARLIGVGHSEIDCI
jgi:hypothetical protein